MYPCCILSLLCSRVTPALLPRLKPPCNDQSSDVMAPFDGSQLLQCHTRAGIQVTLCAHPAAQPALHTELPASNLGNFPPCHQGLGCSEVGSHRRTGESESGLKMLRDQRGEVGRSRIHALGGGLREGKWEGEDLFCYWLFKVVQLKNWINLIWLCFSARLDMLSFLALWIVQYIVCCKIWVCQDRAVVTQPTLGVMQHCWVDSPALPPPPYPW